MNFEQIQSLCRQKGISVSFLEKELGFGNGTIQKWKNGGNATIDKVKKIADYFDVLVDALLIDSTPAQDTNKPNQPVVSPNKSYVISAERGHEIAEMFRAI